MQGGGGEVIFVNSGLFLITLLDLNDDSYVTDELFEAQKGEITCPKIHYWVVARQSFLVIRGYKCAESKEIEG